MKAFTVETPILIPVKEPGPMSQINKFISFKLKLDFFNANSIIGIKFSECVLFVLVSKLQINLVLFKIDTPQILLEVSMLKIFILPHPYIIYLSKRLPKV